MWQDRQTTGSEKSPTSVEREAGAGSHSREILLGFLILVTIMVMMIDKALEIAASAGFFGG